MKTKSQLFKLSLKELTTKEICFCLLITIWDYLTLSTSIPLLVWSIRLFVKDGSDLHFFMMGFFTYNLLHVLKDFFKSESNESI